MTVPFHRRAAKAYALAVAVVFAATACTDGAHGGAGDLPGPVPTGVVFHAPPDDAMTAADFSAPLLDGTPVTASDLWDDRPVVLVFTASWCNRCADVHRDVAEVVDTYDGAVALLGMVAEDDLDGAADYARELRLGHAIAAADDAVWLSYAVHEPPLVALVAPGGKILRGWPGGGDPKQLATHLDELVDRTGERG